METLSKKNTAVLDKAKEIFIKEIKSRLPEAIEALSALKEDRHETNAVDKLYRFSHTLKGSGQMVNLLDIAEPASELCVVLELLKDYEISLQDGFKVFLEERMNDIIYEIENLKHAENPVVAELEPLNAKRKIFVIDDDSSITSFIKRSLELKGYEVNAYNNTDMAEKEFHIENPDLIVLDIVMSSEEEGIMFCRKIRSDYNLRLIPIIFLSKKNELRDKLEGFATGADDYLCKPFEMEELTARIQVLLKRMETQNNLILQDDLTGIYNRRYLEKRLVEEIAKNDRTNGCFSVAMVDIDHFKAINDQYGHAAGDKVLRLFVNTMKENLRTSDVICRYGGEEFVIVFPETYKDHAYKVLERLRVAIVMMPVGITGSNAEINISFSGGIASFPRDGITSSQLMKAADSAMYKAKSSGRNKILLFEEVEKN